MPVISNRAVRFKRTDGIHIKRVAEFSIESIRSVRIKSTAQDGIIGPSIFFLKVADTTSEKGDIRRELRVTWHRSRWGVALVGSDVERRLDEIKSRKLSSPLRIPLILPIRFGHVAPSPLRFP